MHVTDFQKRRRRLERKNYSAIHDDMAGGATSSSPGCLSVSEGPEAACREMSEEHPRGPSTPARRQCTRLHWS